MVYSYWSQDYMDNKKIEERQKAFIEYRILIKILKGIVRFELCCYFYHLLCDSFCDEKAFIITFISFLIIIALLIVIDIFFDHIKKAEKIEFDFDFEKEKSTYLHLNYRWKRLKDGAMSCDSYSQWKQYVIIKYKGDTVWEKEDFKYYLTRKIKNYKEKRHLIELVLIPLLVLGVTILFTVIKTPVNINLFSILIAMLIAIASIEVIILLSIYPINDAIDFLEEFMDIVFPGIGKNSV